jgi:hypothetical protein
MRIIGTGRSDDHGSWLIENGCKQAHPCDVLLCCRLAKSWWANIGVSIELVCERIEGFQEMKKMFSFLSPKKQEINMVDGYRKWRELIFSVKPENAEVSSKEIDRVFGVVMDDVQLDKASKTLWAITQTTFASGESSLKATVGTGVIGLGIGENEENIFAAGQQIIELAQQLFNSAAKTSDYSLPELNVVRFFFLTTSGTYFIDGHIDKIEHGDKRVFEMLKGFIFIRKYGETLIARAREQNPETFSS